MCAEFGILDAWFGNEGLGHADTRELEASDFATAVNP